MVRLNKRSFKEKVTPRKLAFFSIFVLSLSFVCFDAFKKASEERVEVLYFTNPACRPAHRVDELMREIEREFGDKIELHWYNVAMFESDEEEAKEVKALREKYKVYGVPFIVINGEPLRKAYTKENLIKEICKEFPIFAMPKACW